MGFPIRKSSDQSSFAAPRGLSQRTTSFIASQRQGIHRMLLRHLITLMTDARSLTPQDRSQKDQKPGSFDPGLLMLAEHTRAKPRRSRRSRFSRLSSPPWHAHPLHDANRPAPRPFRSRAKSLSDVSGRKGRQRAAGGARRDRTDDLMLAKHALSQLSYGPVLGEAKNGLFLASSAGAGVRPLGSPAHGRGRPFGLASALRASVPRRRKSGARPIRHSPLPIRPDHGGPGTTRTSDLTLIRGAL